MSGVFLFCGKNFWNMSTMRGATCYRSCMVPYCKNTSLKTPEKSFIQVPKNEKRRMLWIKAVRRNHKEFSNKTTTIFVCEDHFDLEVDMENFTRWKLMGGVKLIKESVVPHKFDWKTDGKRESSVPWPAAAKRIQAQLVKEAFESYSQTAICSKAHASTSTATCSETHSSIAANSKECTDTAQLPSVEQETMPTLSYEDKKDVGVMVRPHFRSKETQANGSIFMKSQSCSPFKVFLSNTATSPLKLRAHLKTRKLVKRHLTFSSDESFESKAGASSSQYILPTTSTGSESTYINKKNGEKENELSRGFGVIQAVKHTTRIILLKPKMYLGVPIECMFIIKLIEEHSHLDTISIYLTLHKIRLAQTFCELGDAFGISESTASRTFSKSIYLISELMREFIVWPSTTAIKEMLPLPFRARYSKVQCIIDCLEIEIQKPTDAVKQALTWSDYKKCNTIKYLISSTPDGIINFISKGFGGRTSDALIVEKSGFLDSLPPGCVVMADRGFKHIENLLIEKKCCLLRPPSVSNGQKLDKKQVLETKRIASLRIHIERVIRRLREFKLLRPHSCVSSKLIPYMDFAVIIACGLINLQGPIVR